MKKLTSLLVLMFVGFLTINTFAQSEAELKQMIERNNKIMSDAMKANDVDKAMALYAEDAIQLPNKQEMRQGIAEIRKDAENMVKEGWKVKEYSNNIKSVEAHGDLVTEIGTYSMSVQKEGSNDVHKFKGKYLTLWEKQTDGSLKLKTEVWNEDFDNSSMAESRDMDRENMDNKEWNESDKSMKDKNQKDENKMSEDNPTQGDIENK
jgi:ketosteroid isomerase-like protein